MFSCLYDRKVRDVFAAGGRYDSLIKEHRHRTGSHDDRHAVGFNLAWEKLARIPKPSAKGFLKKAEDEILGFWSAKRVCRLLLNYGNPHISDVSFSVMSSLQVTILQYCEVQVWILFSSCGPTTSVQNWHKTHDPPKTFSLAIAKITTRGS